MKLVIEVQNRTVTGIYYVDATGTSDEVLTLPNMLVCDLDALSAGKNGITKHVAIGLKRANERTQLALIGLALK